MKYRAALASFDGQYVDQHFGHARKYYIYEFDDENESYEFIERRFVDSHCECSLGTSEAFREISDYYRFENENILSDITQAAEPVFILITGAIIISVIAQFVIPVFNLLGAL